MNYQNNFATNLTSNQLAAVTTTPLNSIPTVDAPFYLALDATNVNGNYEVVYCTGKTATNVNHAASSYEHTTAEEVRMIVPASYLNAIQNLKEGEMVNGMISVADTAGITLALKTKAGTDPSVSDPVFAMIGGAVRAITAALSVAKADATNWFDAGSTEHATNEIDYFVYLGYNATDGVVIGFSRIPWGASYDDFSTTTTDEDYCAISTITTAAATDYYNVIGRFAATLSAGAGYTWTVPTYTAKNLIQRPIYDNRVTTPSMPSPHTRLNSKIIVGTRDFTAAAGDVSYTGVGFRPSSLDLIGCVAAGSFPQIWGIADSQKTSFCVDRAFDSNFRTRANYLVFTSPSSGTEIYAIVKSYDADGFTLTWTKGGSPTGTFEFAVKCIR